jgi:hypothetical protein
VFKNRVHDDRKAEYCWRHEGVAHQTVKNRTVTLHMPLPGEGVDVWRPVEAEVVGDDTYRVLGPVPEDEIWAF